MASTTKLLVGDNPFHGISHLSQERAISRGKDLNDPNHAAQLVSIAIDNGADGFLFSMSSVTQSIVRTVCKEEKQNIKLYAIVPYVSEFVRLTVTKGGITGLVKQMAGEILSRGNFGSVYHGAKGLLLTEPTDLFNAYLLYVESMLRSAKGKNSRLESILIHEVLTDMALALDMKWIFQTHINMMNKMGIKPGFDTHNFPYLIKKLKEWGLYSQNLTICTQFNAIGFGMSPSREAYEGALLAIPEIEVIAYGILASGYLKLSEGVEYINKLPQLQGIAIGISKENQARESFTFIKARLN